MDNNNLDLPGNDQNWLDNILGNSNTAKELDVDELAVHAAGLTHPNDLELEKILSEDWDSVPDLEHPSSVQPEADPVILPPAFETDSDYEVDLSLDELFQDEFAQETSQEFQPEADATNVQAESIPEEDTVLISPEQSSPADESCSDDTQFFSPPEQDSTDPDVAKTAERKIRPKFKKGYGLFGIPHILSTGIWLVIILVVGLICGVLLWECTADLMAFGKEEKLVTISITENEVKINPDGTKNVDIEAIAQKLYAAKLIDNPKLFVFFADITKKSQDIDIGQYTLNRIYDYNAMINHMTTYQSARKQIDILIPEGQTCAQIFKLLEENGVCTVSEMEDYMLKIQKPDDKGNLPLDGYWFLADVPRTGVYWLEGFMFPDTYRFYVDDDPENVVKKFMDGFDYRFTDVMVKKLENIKERTGLSLTIHEVVIIASMIEKESANGTESYDISSVIYNRLRNRSYETNGRLEIDATLIYALNGNVDPATGMVKPLTDQDKITLKGHPFNTYEIQGLPPGAISNPGRNSLDAALTPNEDTGYYYYVFNPQAGTHMFAATLSEHEKNIAYINTLD